MAVQPTDLQPGVGERAQQLVATYSNLQVASAMVGYLESQLKDCQDQLTVVTQAEESRAELERVNDRMAMIAERARIAEEIARQNEAMRQILEAKYKPASLWDRIRGVLLLGQTDADLPQELEMEDYYSMIQRTLDQ